MLILAIPTATLSVTISFSKGFSSFRLWVKRRSRLLGSVIACPFCLSFYLAAAQIVGFELKLISIKQPFDFIISELTLVGVGAVYIGILSRAFIEMENVPKE